jgi:hypothetical protein
MRKIYALTACVFLLVSAGFSQNVSVNPGAGSYATLRQAFDAINAGTHTGAVAISIVANTVETATATLNASGSGSASYTSVTITAANTVTVTGSLAAPLISLNGADNVTINGLNGAGTGINLTLTNTGFSSTAGTSTIRLINDATSNTITNCNILGSALMVANTTTAGGVVLFSTATTTGNDNNTLSNNNIGPAGSNLPSRGVASLGTSTATNSGNQVINNNIYDIFNATYSTAIYLDDNNVNWTMNNNRIYQTSTRTGSGTGVNYGIFINGSAVAENFTITGNTIGYASNTQTGTYKLLGASTTFQGIAINSKTTTTASTISNNTIGAVTVANTSTTVNYGINFIVGVAGGVPVTLTNNTVTAFSGTGNLYAIAYTGTATAQACSITGNIVSVINLTGTARFYGILYNPGDGGVSTAISGNTVTDVNLNGTASGSATGSPALTCIYVASGPATISNNIIGSQSTTGSVSCVQTSGSTSAYDVLGIFVKGIDNLSVTNNTIGGLYADNTLATSGTARIFGIRTSSTGTVSCSGNIIGGTIANSIQLASTFTGASILAIYNSAGTSTFDGNTIRNITSGSGTGTGANSSLAGICNGSNNVTSVTNNTIYNLSSPGSSVGGIIFVTGTTSTISGNTVYSLAGSGTTTPAVTGIHVIAATTGNVYKNKIYALSQSAAFTNAGGVNGLLFSGGTTVNAYNNIIGSLTSPAANSIDAIRGISVTSTTVVSNYNIYFNTIYLAATSTGTDFGTSTMFHAGSTTATTAALDIKNNIFINKSTASGTGLIAALKRWSGTGIAADLANYAVNSNNNLFYAGTPASSKVIYSDSINSDQTLAAFKTRVAPRETASVTEDVPFISTTGANATYLHIDPAIATLVESHGVNTGGITVDYDGQTRQGNVGYAGTGTAPDLGADEGAFTIVVLPVSFLSFRGDKLGATNKLEWITATESGNKGFELQRSVDGRNYSTIGTIASKADNGNSTTAVYYSFIDAKPFASSSYYRLKQLNKDGRSGYSTIVLMKSKVGTMIVTSIYPNPASNVLNIAIAAPANNKINFVIIDLSGKMVLQQNAELAEGSNIVPINITRLAPGQYMLKVIYENNSETAVRRFVKQ